MAKTKPCVTLARHEWIPPPVDTVSIRCSSGSHLYVVPKSIPTAGASLAMWCTECLVMCIRRSGWAYDCLPSEQQASQRPTRARAEPAPAAGAARLSGTARTKTGICSPILR
eukprot:scaffold439725_cov51-Prasinocladus_malaysianus.AAC.1